MTQKLQSAEKLHFCLDGKGGIYTGEESFSDIDQNIPFWENLDYKNPDTYKTLVEDYQLEPNIADALCDDDTRPHFFVHEKGILIILRAANLNPGSEPDDMISLRIWIDNDKMISLEHRKLKAITLLANSLMDGCGPKNSMQCFFMLSQYVVDAINDIVKQLIEKTDDLEEQVLDVKDINDFDISSRMTDLRREIISMRRYLAPMKDLFQNLQNEKSSLINTKGRTVLRELSNDMAKSLEDLDYCRDHISLYYEELQGKMSISMNRIMYTISIFTAIFLPLTLITGLLGINVSGIPYAENNHAFIVVCLLMLLIAAGLYALMKKLRWM